MNSFSIYLGKKANLTDTLDVDWIPSINLGYQEDDCFRLQDLVETMEVNVG